MISRAKPEIPDVLYKYRSLSGDRSKEHVRQTIVENEVYFCSPSSFNDPFDCRVHFSFEGDDEAWIGYLRGFLAKHRPELDRNQREAEIHRIVTTEHRHRDPQVLRDMLDDLQNQIYDLGVFSLSARNDGNLMWSYYAHHHEGICLGFLHRVGPLGPAFPVEYSSNFPQMDWLNDDYNSEVILLTKADAWRHEREWRVMDWHGGPGIREYPPELLREVILGARISEKDRDQVLSWVEAHNPRPRVLEVALKAGEYGLEIRES
jgi:hypothetical protein